MGTEILEVSDRLLAAVVNGIYQGILLTVLVALGFRVFHRTNAATRHAVWLCTLVFLVVLVAAHCFFDSRPPALQAGTIAWTVPTPKQESGTASVAAVEVATHGTPTEASSPGSERTGYFTDEQEPVADGKPDRLSSSSTELPDEGQTFSAGSLPSPAASPREDESNNPSVAVEPLPASAADRPSSGFATALRRLVNPVSVRLGLESRASRIAGAILLGVCLVLSVARLFMLLSRLRQIQTIKRQSFPASERLRDLFQGLVARIDVGRRVDLKTLPTSQSSVVLGFLHPVILLPAEPMEPAEAEPILRHELAHVRRRDDWANLLQHFLLATFPFHPAAWWISKRLSLEREIACDDDVLQSTAHPRAYALLLADLAARMHRCPPLLAPGASNNKTQLQQRIDMILDTRRNTSPRLAVTRLTFMASAAALFAATAICLAPRIVLAQGDAAPAAANAQVSIANEPAHDTPAVESAAAAFSSRADEAASRDAVLPLTPQPAAVGPGPKRKTAQSSAATWQPALAQAQPTPAAPVATAALAAPPAPQMAAGSISLSAAPASEPRPGRAPRPVPAEPRDSSLEERLERLEKMVESLMARGEANGKSFHLKPSAGLAGPMDRKEITEMDAQAKHQAESEREQMRNAEQIEKIKEQAKRQAARAADQAKRAETAVKRVAKAEQKRQSGHDLKEGSERELDELRKQLEILEREREKVERQIEDIERRQEQSEEQREVDPDSDKQPDAPEVNADSIQAPRQ